MLPDIFWSLCPGIADFLMAICCIIDGLLQGLVRGLAPIEQVPGMLDTLNTIWEVLFT